MPATFTDTMPSGSFLETVQRGTSFASTIAMAVQGELAQKARSGERASWKRLKSGKVDAEPSEPLARAIEDMAVSVTAEQLGDTTIVTSYLTAPEGEPVDGVSWNKKKGSRRTQFMGALDDLVYGSEPEGERHSSELESDLGDEIAPKIASLLSAEEAIWT